MISIMILLLMIMAVAMAMATDQPSRNNLHNNCSLRFHTESNFGVYSLSDATVDFWGVESTPGFQQSPCILGISHWKELVELQFLLVNATYEKMLVVIRTDELPQNESLPAEDSMSLQIDRKHYPIQIVEESPSNKPFKVKVLCRKAQKSMMVKVGDRGQWALTEVFHGSWMERYCNYGQNMVFGKQLTLATIGLPPYVLMNANFKLTGVNIDLLETVANHLGARTNVLLLPGTNLDTGDSWSSPISKVFYGEADLADDILLSGGGGDKGYIKRWMITSKTKELYPWDFVIGVSLPKERPVATNLFFIWDRTTWVLFFVSFIAVTFTYGLLAFKLGVPVKNSVWIPYGILFQEFHDYHPDGLQSQTKQKIALMTFRMTWVIVSFLLMQAAVGNFKSLFVLKRYEEGINSIQEVLDKDLSIFMASSFQGFLQLWQFEDPLIHGVQRRAQEKGTIVDLSLEVMKNTIARAAHEDLGLLGIPETLLFLKSEYQKQGLDFPVVNIPQKLISYNVCYAFPYHSPMKLLFDKVLSRIQESGVILHLFEKHSPYRSIKDQVFKTQTENVKLGIAPIMTPIILVVAGLGLAALSFVMEIFYMIGKSMIRSKKQNRSIRGLLIL